MPMACRMTPPFPEVSMPCSTTKIFWFVVPVTRATANKRS